MIIRADQHPTFSSRTFTTSCFRSLGFLTVYLLLLTAGVVRADERPTEYDELGNAAFTAAEGEITYTREELSSARSALPLMGAAAFPGTSTAAVAGAAAIEEPYLVNLDLVWRHSVWGSNLGESGITAVDLEGDGTTEIVLGATLSRNFGANKNWHVLRHDPISGRYQIVFTSNDNPDWYSDQSEINSVSVFKFGTKQRILVGYSTGKLSVFDGATLSLIREIDVTTQAILSVVQADGDNDGSDEILVSTQSATHLYNPLTFAKEGEFPVGGREISVGNVDNDPELEIVFVEGPVIEFDGAIFTEEWDFSEFTPGRWLELGDLDGDGVQELIVARAWDYIDVLDARNRSPLRQVTTDIDISQLKVADVTGDSKPEILYGDQQHGYVHAVDGVTSVELWRLKNPSSGAPGIEVADVDDDGALEVIWGSGSNSTAPDFLSIHDIATLQREFVSYDEGGPFRALAMGNADDDAEEEFVFAAYEGDSYKVSNYVSATPLHVISSVDFSREWNAYDYPLGGSYYGYYDIAIGDVDGQGSNEIVAAFDWLYDLNLNIIDGTTRTLKSTTKKDLDPALSIALADFDGTGINKIIGTSQKQLHIFDGSSLNILWSSIVLAGSSSSASIDSADLSGDGIPDLIASVSRLLVINGASKIYRQTAETDYRGFAIAEDAQGNKQIWAGTSGGLLVKVNPNTLVRQTLGSICTGAVNSVTASTSTAFDGSIQFACDNTIGIWGLAENQVIWRSPVLGTQVGLLNNLVATEQGDKAVLMVGTGYGVYAFRGFEIGNRDIDDDGMLNHLDNCPQDANPNQEDLDQDSIGDACNNAGDRDGDEWSDTLDNCPLISNPGQEDTDSSGRGDACETLPPGC